ncbi:MAG: hypothetical protein A2453_03810 [Candidatus Raymondbacteria bacterium RIFOXYC2_FULL_50_21]|nr:MAG: hypothetical protein A2453_03810 [Candidatus Raymondbacteria bacterium RIFOXYC2_FULL_50_21]
MKNKNYAHPLKGQEGQVFVLFIVLVPMLLFVLFSVANIAFLVHDRTRLQNSADAAALTAAEWQARGLNQIAMANACIKAGDLLKRSYGPRSGQTRMIEAEQRSFTAVISEVERSIPKFASEAARKNGVATLLSTPHPAKDRSNSRPWGAEILGTTGAWRYQFSGNQFQDQASRVLAVAWRRSRLSGVMQTVFNRFDAGPGYAFASAYAHSPSLLSTSIPIVPDFTAEITPVLLTGRAYAYIKDNLQLHFIGESQDEINTAILH